MFINPDFRSFFVHLAPDVTREFSTHVVWPGRRALNLGMAPVELPESTTEGAGMDAATQYRRFKAVVKELVASRKRFHPSYAATDWVVQCHDSIERFMERFPDRFTCEAELTRLEAAATERASLIDATATHFHENGLGYLDIERIQYEFPLMPD